MHDTTNTLDGRYGFFVQYADGRRLSEREALWDEISRSEPVKAIGLVDFKAGVVLLDLTGYEKFYFANEAVSLHSSQAVRGQVISASRDRPVVAAKVFGGVKNGLADEVRIGLLGEKPRMESKRTFPAAELKLTPASYRGGVHGGERHHQEDGDRGLT